MSLLNLPQPTVILAPFEVEHPAVNFTRNSPGTRVNRQGQLEQVDPDQFRHTYNPETGIYEGRIIEGEQPAPVSLWHFDGDVTDSAGSNDGTINGDPTFVPGVVGQALEFDEVGDYVNCGTDASLDITSEITLSAWIKTPSYDSKLQDVITKGGSFGQDTAYYLAIHSDGRLFFEFNNPDATRQVVSHNLANNNIPTGEFIHICGTYDGAIQRLYLNGELVSSSYTTGSIRTINNPVTIGGNGRDFVGSIDEPRIYNRALLGPEIKSQYENPEAWSSITEGKTPDIATVTDLDSIGYNPNEGTFVFEFIADYENQRNIGVLGNDSAGVENWTICYRNGSSDTFLAYDGSSGIEYPSLDSHRNKYAFAYDDSSAQTAGNGVLGEGGPFNLPQSPKFQLGKRLSNVGVTGSIKFINLLYYPRRLSDAQLKAITS